MEGPSGGSPPEYVALSPAAATEIGETVRYVRGVNRSRTPRKGKGLSAWSNSGAWGFLAGGATITAASGATLGSGSVRLCSRSVATLTADGDTVDVYNAGGSVSGPLYIKLGWTDGDWSIDVAKCP
jgi:hypothetical protein